MRDRGATYLIGAEIFRAAEWFAFISCAGKNTVQDFSPGDIACNSAARKLVPRSRAQCRGCGLPGEQARGEPAPSI